MKTDNNPDIAELEFLSKAKGLIDNRIKELLYPRGLRKDQYIAWPFKLREVLEPILMPGHYTKGKEVANYAKASAETQKEIVQQPRPLDKGKNRVPGGKGRS